MTVVFWVLSISVSVIVGIAIPLIVGVWKLTTQIKMDSSTLEDLKLSNTKIVESISGIREDVVRLETTISDHFGFLHMHSTKGNSGTVSFTNGGAQQ